MLEKPFRPETRVVRRNGAQPLREHSAHICVVGAGISGVSAAIEAARPYLTEEQLWQTSNFLRIGGAIIGIVYARRHGQLTDADSKSALIDCGSVQRFGLTLEQPTIIEAIPVRGKQGIWYYKG